MVLHRWRKSLKGNDKGINNVSMKVKKKNEEGRDDVAVRSYPELKEPRRPRVKFQVGATWHGTVEHSLSTSIFLFRFGSVGFWIFTLLTFMRLVVSRANQKWDPPPVLRRHCHSHHHHPSPTTPQCFSLSHSSFLSFSFQSI